jgi:hypothetical protein
MDETFELARAELSEERESKSILMGREVERRTHMAQRVIKRMLQGALSEYYTGNASLFLPSLGHRTAHQLWLAL